MIPIATGFRFNPTDEELIEILNQKVSGKVVTPPLDFIAEGDVYELEPQDLQWTESVILNKNERYYYCKRESDSREVAGRGWWKATSHVKSISSATDGRVVGSKRPLTFHRFRDITQRNRKDAIRTDWIMHEYALIHSIPTEWRLCKIKYNGKEKLKEDMENNIRNRNSSPMMSSSSSSSSLEAAAGSSSSINYSPMQQFANNFQEQQPLVTHDHENDSGTNSIMRFEMMIDDDHHTMSSIFDPSCLITPPNPMLTTPTHHFASSQQQQQDNINQPAAAAADHELPFIPDLWSAWENWH